jgi:hypothetical protein
LSDRERAAVAAYLAVNMPLLAEARRARRSRRRAVQIRKIIMRTKA